MFFTQKKNKSHNISVKIFSIFFIFAIIFNLVIPLFNIKSGVAFAQSGQTSDNAADNNTTTDKKLNKQEVDAKVRAMVIDIIQRSMIEAGTVAARDNSTINNLTLKYISDNKDIFVTIFDKAISEEKSYRDALGLILTDIETKAGWEGEKLENGAKSQVIANLYSNFGKLRGKLSVGIFWSQTEFTEKELKEALQDTQDFSTSNTKDLIGSCSTASSLAQPFCLAIWFILESLVGAIAGIAYIFIKIFESAISTYILNISTLFQVKATSLGEGLAGQNLIFVMWKMARDIVNVLVFFSAAYIGIRRILGDEGDFIKNIVRVLMFAFLVNFSYPIAKFFIDLSNISSLFVYKSIIDPNMVSNGSLADIILANIGFGFMSKLFGSGEPIEVTSNFASPSPWWSLVLVSMLSLIMLFVFAFLSVMILVRAFILIICVIFSPLMFAAGFLGKMDDLHKKWMENFFNNIIFAPLMMLGLYIVLNILISSKPPSTAVTVQTSDIDSLGRLILAMVGFVLVYYVSKVISGSVGTIIGGAVGKGLTTAGMFMGGGLIAGGLVKGAGALMGRVAGSKAVQDASKSPNSKFRKFAANAFIKSTDKVQNMKAGVGRFAKTTTYAQDVKSANVKTLNQNRDFLNALPKEQRDKIMQASKNIKYVEGQKQLNNNLDSIANIKPEIDANGNMIRDRVEDRSAITEELANNVMSEKVSSYTKSDQQLKTQEYIQSKKESLANVVNKVSPVKVSANSRESIDKLRSLKIAKQNNLNDLVGRDKMRTVEDQNTLKEKLKTERARRESVRSKQNQDFLTNNVEDIAYRDSDGYSYDPNNPTSVNPS